MRTATTVLGAAAGLTLALGWAGAASAATTLSGLNASGTPYVWDGNKSINYQDPGWLTRLIS